MDEKQRIPETEDTDLPAYLFHQGTNFEAYSFMGVHCMNAGKNARAKGEMWKYSVRVWAPNAIRVEWVGDLPELTDGWKHGIPLTRVTEGGIWELHYQSAVSLEGVF